MRSSELEILDTREYTQEEYAGCLKRLGQVGRWLGGDRATLWALRQWDESPSSILDVGCGGGSFLHSLTRVYPTAELRGIDLNNDAIRYAESHFSAPHLIYSCESLEGLPDNSFDIVIATLVCHHLPDSELPAFIRQCMRVAKKGVIFNDLHRHRLASVSFALMAPLLFRNRLITHDGLISIRRAFTRRDWVRLLSEAGVSDWKLSWHWAFRWVVRIVC